LLLILKMGENDWMCIVPLWNAAAENEEVSSIRVCMREKKTMGAFETERNGKESVTSRILERERERESLEKC